MTSTPHRLLGWAAAAGTLPYLTLKALWITGSDVGTTDPALVHGTAMVALNGVTAVLDLVVVALALALTHPVGRRLPAWLVLLPMWVGTGLLVPVAVGILPATLLATADPSTPPDFLEPWVRPLVYGGFAWQAVFLLAAFALHARSRWTPARGTSPLLPATATGGVVLAVLAGVLHVVLAVRIGVPAVAVQETVSALLAFLGAAGVVALVRGSAHRVTAVVAAWTGSAALFAWGLWTTALVTTAAPLVTPDAVAGGAHLAGLLGGFALAVAGLLAVTAAPTPTPHPRVAVSGPASR
ncbi:hypothetical protein [Pseudonocardia abyssalis]|uniref:LigA protein n=1 Tax=Pseudonocardia abyssalis TaxID=2792008 RepID=A0ABS6UMI1_9PSEU|nr:hypothetical protein [Pseudonocardia abyssalis]MBW0117612.1 hypothetical protein [Pseudonocardia abyssalis]MBW0133455.1 hypothetical protein [Pseudonocardia abyssalis]